MDWDLNTLLKVAAFSPDRVNRPSAWKGHIPFAAWLVATMRPKLLVELGTHHGHSFLAMCRSAKAERLQIACYAVDTWTGDEHSTQYGEDVFAELSAYNQKHYASFATLMRMTFDEAVSYFDDASVDLLHIDGLHTYEAVSHDFRTWIPKVAPGGIVLFHDTNIRERNFGVWKFWEELKQSYSRTFEFTHSAGLGVLQVPGADTARLDPLFDLSPEKAQLLREYFVSLGSHMENAFAVPAQGMMISNLEHTLQSRNAHISGLENALASRDAHITGLEQGLAFRDSLVIERDRLLAERDQHIANLYASRSWRVSAPLRRTSRALQRVRRSLGEVRRVVQYAGGPMAVLRKTTRTLVSAGVGGVWKKFRHIQAVRRCPSARESLLDASCMEHHDKHTPIHTAAVDIVVCVHNALQDVQRCLESVLRNTMPPYRLILVDDGSDAPTQEYLAQFSAEQSALLIRNEVARGYTLAANQGLRSTKGDVVVLLNSDTEVPPLWLDRLVMCAASNSRIGLVGPLSNTASWQSVPEILDAHGDWMENPLPQGWTVPQFADEIARVSPRIYPRVGVLNGFCLLITRAALEDVGLFDEEAFAQGYGEENDYCFRAVDRGWELAVADDCYVFHAQSKSYSTQRRLELAHAGGEALAAKHGHQRIQAALACTAKHPALQFLRARSAQIKNEFLQRAAISRLYEGRRILFLLPVVHAGGGSNIVFLEAACMRACGVDVWIANFAVNRAQFEEYHPDLSIPVLYLQETTDLLELAGEFDAIIATVYTTVYWLLPLTRLPQPPVLGYYIQDFEPDFFPEGSQEYLQALASYTAVPQATLFTKTAWNRDMLDRHLGLRPQLIGPSFDPDLHHPAPLVSVPGTSVRIVAMVRPCTPRRGPEMTMRVLKQLALHHGDAIECVIFGVEEDDVDFCNYPKDFSYQNLGILPAARVHHVLSQADIFLDCSTFQAMGLTAMEAMAAGAAVVGPAQGGLSEIITSNHNGLLVDTTNEAAVIQAVSSLVYDRALLERLRNNAFGVLRHLPMYAAHRMLNCLFEGAAETPTGGE